jgi:hypothetical protein
VFVNFLASRFTVQIPWLLLSRKLDRLSGENEDLLQQLETFSTDLKKTANENAALKQAANENAALKAKCEKLQKAADKAMELEASLICLREKEKQLTAKASQVDDLSGGDGQENFSIHRIFCNPA